MNLRGREDAKAIVNQLWGSLSADYGRCSWLEPITQTDELRLGPLSELEECVATKINGAATFRTSALIAVALVRELLSVPDAIEWSEIEQLAETACEFIQSNAMQANSVDELVRVATTAANGDSEIALKTVSALRTMGKLGIPNYSLQIADRDERIVERYEEAGHFPFETRPTQPIDDPMVVVSSRAITSSQWLNLLDAVEPPRRVVCFSSAPQRDFPGVDSVELPDAMSPHEKTLWLGDVAAWCGARVISQSSVLTLETIGRAGRVAFHRDKVLVYDPINSQDEINERIESYLHRIDGYEVMQSKARIQEHVSSIGAPYVELELYGSDEDSLKRLWHFTLASMAAARSAIALGFVPGGGVRLVQAAERIKTPETDPIPTALRNAMQSPFRAQLEGEEATHETAIRFAVENPDSSLDAIRQTFVPASRGGPLDPSEFATQSLRNATQTAHQLWLSLDLP